jgi:hypothetical protein
MNYMNKCGCGRSPTGMCKGWHGLTEQEYVVKNKQYEEENGE